MTSITVSSRVRPYIEYTRMLSPISQYRINLVVSLSIMRGPGLLMNVLVQKHCALNNQIFCCGEVHYSIINTNQM